MAQLCPNRLLACAQNALHASKQARARVRAETLARAQERARKRRKRVPKSCKHPPPLTPVLVAIDPGHGLAVGVNARMVRNALAQALGVADFHPCQSNFRAKNRSPARENVLVSLDFEGGWLVLTWENACGGQARRRIPLRPVTFAQEYYALETALVADTEPQPEPQPEPAPMPEPSPAWAEVVGATGAISADRPDLAQAYAVAAVCAQYIASECEREAS